MATLISAIALTAVLSFVSSEDILISMKSVATSPAKVSDHDSQYERALAPSNVPTSQSNWRRATLLSCLGRDGIYGRLLSAPFR
jgi:hypothetical protein